ncbi:MAG: HNH endonuclease [Oligoflexia bacterium]|nr:HNH endonuclease [Oligoflexia bacterium]
MIDVLQEIDQARAYRELGYRSAFEYATQSLRLSESVAYNFITVARKASEVPILKEKIASQEITLSNARLIVPVLTPENQAIWISAAQGLSKRQLEKEVAKERPEILTPERARYVQADRIKLEMGVSEELHLALKRAQDLVSSKLQKAASLEKTLQVLVGSYLDREHPLAKAERAEARKTKKAGAVATTQQQPAPGQVPGHAPGHAFLRVPIQASLKHAVIRRDKYRCTYRDEYGNRCPERRWLDCHHKRAVSDGGGNSLENLVTVCRGHHQVLHLLRL